MLQRLILIPILACISVGAIDHVLTVAETLQTPSKEHIQKKLEDQGGTYNLAAQAEIEQLVQAILRDSLSQPDMLADSTSPTEAIKSILSSKPCALLTKVIAEKLNKHIPSLTYGYFMQRLLDAFQKSHQSIALQKEHIAREDREIQSSPILRTAHALARDIVVSLLFIMVSPQAHPCERIHALYTLNLVNLAGTRRVALERFRDRANRFYFTYDGTLREYDPTRISAQTPKHLKALTRFLKALSTSKTDYIELLTKGISYGIVMLKDPREQALKEAWTPSLPGFMWRYAARIFQEATMIDVIKMRTVTPEQIFAHQANKDFVSLMLQCTLTTNQPDLRACALAEAQSYIIKLKQMASATDPMVIIMERYYNETCKRAR